MSHRRLVGLTCVYCDKPLTSVDATNFIEKKLKLNRRHGRPQGVCNPCLLQALTVERRCYFQEALLIGYLERKLGFSVSSLNLRCAFCGSVMSEDDKHYQRLNHRHCVKVRNRWRGICYMCITSSMDSYDWPQSNHT